MLKKRTLVPVFVIMVYYSLKMRKNKKTGRFLNGRQKFILQLI